MPIGMPGWPDFACSTASIANARIALAMRRSFGSRGEERGDTLAGALVSLLIPAKMVHPGYEDKPPDGHVRNQKLYKNCRLCYLQRICSKFPLRLSSLVYRRGHPPPLSDYLSITRLRLFCGHRTLPRLSPRQPIYLSEYYPCNKQYQKLARNHHANLPNRAFHKVLPPWCTAWSAAHRLR